MNCTRNRRLEILLSLTAIAVECCQSFSAFTAISRSPVSYAKINRPRATFVESIKPFPRKSTLNFPSSLLQSSMGPSEFELYEQKDKAYKSFKAFHKGNWTCNQGAISFSISSDASAGIISKKISAPYQTIVSTRGSHESNDLKMTESISWKSEASKSSNSGDAGFEANTFLSSRTVDLGRSFDIDAVDASYSIDGVIRPKRRKDADSKDDSNYSFLSVSLPQSISGLDPSKVDFIIEHTLVASTDERVRCFLLYADNNKDLSTKSSFIKPADSRLVRVVVCEETKDEDPESSVEVIDKDVSVENSKMERFMEAMGDSKNPKLERCSLSLFALTLGPWLGDSIIRDRSDIDSLPAAKFKKKKGYNLPPKKGFGPEDSGSLQASIEEERNGFGCWSNGVQKVAMTFNYEENEVSHDFTWGKSIGAYTSAEMQNWQAKGVIDKNGMFSWLKPSERPLYIDYYSGSYAGCIVGSTYIRAPRFLEFSEITKGRERTTFTEFALFTKGGSGRDPSVALFDPDFMSNLDDDFQDIFCSRISRFYDTDGRLKQGSTSFFTLKNMMYDEFKPDSSSPVVD